jgi:hypothetical protein
MSECTELSLDAKLRKDMPKEILAILRYMLESEEGAPPPSLPDPDEPLFATKLWRVMLRTDAANLSYRRSSLRYDETAAAHVLCVQCSLPNDDELIEKFIDWVMRYLDEPAGKPLGFYRWQRSKWPTPIHMWRRPANGEGAFGTKTLPYASDVPHDIDKIDQAALAVLYISRHDNYGAWKGIDWEVMGRLHQRGYISNPVSKAKSVTFSDTGMREAARLFRTLFAP